MAQTYYATIDGTEKVKDSRPKLVANYEALRSNFNGASLPTSPAPVEGQCAFIGGAWYTYNSGSWKTDDTLHNHDSRYYTETEVNTLLGGYSLTSHNHDASYYTKTACDTLLAGKAATSHTHDDRYYTEAEIGTILGGYSLTSHNHDASYYTKSTVDTLLAGKAASVHYHDDRYYTESEVDSKFSAVVSRSMAFYDVAGTYTFTVPAGVTKIFATGCAGGGGGGGSSATNAITSASSSFGSSTGGSGGAGGSFINYQISVTPGQQITITVGAGGVGGAGGGIGLNGVAGSVGGSSSVGAYCSATGGGGGGGGIKGGAAGNGGAGGVGSHLDIVNSLMYNASQTNSLYEMVFTNGQPGRGGTATSTTGPTWTSGSYAFANNYAVQNGIFGDYTASVMPVSRASSYLFCAGAIEDYKLGIPLYANTGLDSTISPNDPSLADGLTGRMYGGGGSCGGNYATYGVATVGRKGGNGSGGFVMLEW